MPRDLGTIVSQFVVPGALAGVEPYGGGHINESYRLTYRGDGKVSRFLLQRINDRVFADPTLVMDNVQRVTAHIAEKLISGGLPDVHRRVLTLLPTVAGARCFRDQEGGFWRLYLYIEGTRVRQTVSDPNQAREAGRAFGRFQHQLADLAPPRLHETIPDFHHTPRRLEALLRAVEADAHNRAARARAEIEFALDQGATTRLLLDLHQRGEIPQRVIHNDAKISNVLLDEVTGEGLCVVDLDTVMPGLAPYDFGDMVRSMTGTAAEDEPDLSQVEIRMPLFDALARGYLESAGHFLTTAERAHLVGAGQVITLEQGLRFLTDYLNGDTYYQTQRPYQNLDRCRTQFALVKSMVRWEDRMTRLIQTL